VRVWNSIAFDVGIKEKRLTSQPNTRDEGDKFSKLSTWRRTYRWMALDLLGPGKRIVTSDVRR